MYNRRDDVHEGRHLKIFTITLLLSVQGCVFLTHRINEDVEKQLPNLHRKDYGTIEYVDATRERSQS